MPEAAPTAATAAPVTASAPAATPAAPAAPLTATVMETVLATARAKAVIDPTKPPEAKPPEPKPEAKPPEPKQDLALKRLSKLEKENLDYKAKVVELEKATVNAKAYEEAQRLLKSGKQLDAIKAIAGADFTQEEEDALVMAILETPRPAAKTPAELKVDELAAKFDADAKARKDLETQQAQTLAAAAEADTATFAMHALDTAVGDDGAPRFDLCSRPENRTDATKLAIEHASALAIARNIDPDTLTPDVARKLLQDAFADVEGVLEAAGQDELSAWEKKYKRAPKAPQGQAPQPLTQQAPQAQAPPVTGKEEGRKEPQIRPPSLTKPPVHISTKQSLSLIDQIKESNRARAIYN